MTQKERPSSPQPAQIQSPYYPPEDEISLVDLLEVLFRKKILIIGITSVFTVLAILYAQSITPTYRAEIGFLPPDDANLGAHFPDSIAHILPGKTTYNKDGEVTNQNRSLFYKFLTAVQSYQMQKKVFIEGNFLLRFVDNNPNVDMGKEIVREINESIQISTDSKGGKKGAKDAFDETIYLEMEGTKPEVISDFLNVLVESAKNWVINNTKESIQRQIKAQISNLAVKLENLRSNERSLWALKIRDLSENLKIAKKLGVVENSFNLLPSTGASSTVVFQKGEQPLITLQKEQSLPVWFLYGERALQQELDSLKQQLSVEPYSEEIAELSFQIEDLSRIDVSKINFEPVIISQPSIPPAHPIKPDKRKIVGLGIALGLFVGILAAFFSNLVGQLRARQSSTQEE